MKNIVVLISGSGSNLQNIIRNIDAGAIPDTKITMVVADRECFGLQHAKSHDIVHKIIPRGKDFSSQLAEDITEDTDLIVLAGFLSILSSDFTEKFKGKIINLHPALLPKFGGKGMWGEHVHRAVIAAGDAESGASVHFVTSEIDGGEIILQKSVPLEPTETPATLAAKIHEVEFEILPAAINKILGNDR